MLDQIGRNSLSEGVRVFVGAGMVALALKMSEE